MNAVDPKILGQILLLQSTLHIMRDNEAMARFVCRGLSEIPLFESVGMVINAQYYSEGGNLDIPAGECHRLFKRLSDERMNQTERERCLSEFNTRHHVQCLRIETSFSLYGFLLVRPVDAGIPETMLPYIQNSLNLIALIIENNQQQEALLRGKEHLEKTIAERTRELEDANRALTAEITERKQAEHERTTLQEQLLQAQKLESIGRLAGGVAHDFNNMLGVILGHTEMLMDQMVQMDQMNPLRAELEEIRTAAKRSADLTRQLLAFARKQLVTPRVLDLNEAITGLLKMLRRLIGETIDLIWMPGPNLWPVRIDPAQIDQLIANLCINARDAISGMGTITIATENITLDKSGCTLHPERVPGDHVMITVSDDGCGMEKKVMMHLFEPFFTTKEVGRGTGLGLATAHGIIKQNHGFIEADSAPGKGAVFRMYLPRQTVSADIARTVSRETILRGRDEVVLLVEDEPAILNMIRSMLEKLGYQVLCAAGPDQALQMAENHAGKIHLLITDVIMPGMNGRDLVEKLVSMYPHLKHMFMSGYSADTIAHQGVLDEGVPFLQKPFSRKELSVKLRAVLDQRGGNGDGQNEQTIGKHAR